MQSMSTNVNIGFLLIALTALASTMAAETCESLTGLKVPNTTIVASRQVAAGSFTPPPGFQPNPLAGLAAVPASDLPVFCAVTGVIRPAKASEIGFELWMPVSNWNHKFIGVGNGGFGGTIPYSSMTAPLSGGYAVAATDTGHTQDNTPSFALGHPEKWVDFAYRAVHEMTLKAKLIIAAYYGGASRRSYWFGCSQGGRQALSEAQRFPEDYDAIVASAPVIDFTHLTARAVWRGQAIDHPGAVVTPAKLALLHRAVLEACDAQDGLTDGIIDDPRRCDFDPTKLLCKQGDEATCLTAPQVQAVRQFYASVVNPRTKQQIYPGAPLGSELGWGGFGMDPTNRSRGGPGDYFKFVIFQDPNWNYRTFDFDSELARADQIDNGLTKNTNPDLTDFFRRGGKLLQFHGWSDPSPAPQISIQYYESVRDFMGGASKLQSQARLFMIPGMGHCRGGDGPNQFDAIRAIEEWVEAGRAPDRITASHLTDGKVDRTRPLCPYPQVAKYKGTGSTDDAASFVCTLPR